MDVKKGFCLHCGERIDPDQAIKYPNCPEFLHIECAIRVSVGSEAHQTGRCSCFGGTDGCGDPENRSPRENARAAFRVWEGRRGFN